MSARRRRQPVPGRRRRAGIRQPYRDCLICQGVGTLASPCHDCGQQGKRRPQLVLTVVNADTGAVASANVTPGGIDPRPAPGGRWELALTPIVRELAGAVGATALAEINAGGGSVH